MLPSHSREMESKGEGSDDLTGFVSCHQCRLAICGIEKGILDVEESAAPVASHRKVPGCVG